uniref:Putative transcriptional repressor n=1 Tax=uncultured bacterium BLR18 TaxID=506518 RepID=B5L5W0_9BACT|nr:putative transcriptional repressor [uncultured bacterium BLR18]
MTIPSVPPTPSVPSATELCVLKALWKRQPLSTREIHDVVAQELGWTLSSTRKTVERMLDKGMVSQATVHGVQVYTPVLEKVGTLAALCPGFRAACDGTRCAVAGRHVHRQQAGRRHRIGRAGAHAQCLAGR